jgi:hypothetical protein
MNAQIYKNTLFYFLTFVFIFNSHLTAQSSLLSDEVYTSLRETGNWNGLYMRLRLSDKIYYYGEHHYRRRNSEDNLYDFVGRMRQWYNRGGINYIYNENFNLIFGPTLVLNYAPNKVNERYDKITIEPRIWHQWLFIMPYIGRVKFYHQFRFEHRWKRSNLKGSDFQYTDRYRYKFFAYIPINNYKLDRKTLFISPSVEMFFETGKFIKNPFEDFRIYNGIGYILNEKYTVFGGHMLTFGPDITGLNYLKSQIIRLNVFITLDIRKSKEMLPKIHMMY